jgi:hypothetical protein
MATVARLGWTFRSPLGFSQMKDALNPTPAPPWVLGDSEHLGDYLGGRLTEEAVARIYVVQDGFLVNLLFTSLNGDVKAQFQVAQQKLLEHILPLLGAIDITATDPLE